MTIRSLPLFRAARLPRRWSLPLVALAVLLAPLAMQAAPKNSPPLVPANMQPITDSMGFIWDISQDGRIGSGTNGCFSGAMMLQVNQSQFNMNGNPMMTADGSQFVLTGSANNFDVVRWIKIDTKGGFVRYADTFHNNSNVTAAISVSLVSTFSSRFQGLYSDRGQIITGSLGPKDNGLVVDHAQPSRPSALFIIGTAGAKTRPTIMTQQSYQLSINYNGTVEAGKSITFATLVAQRAMTSAPGAAASAQVPPLFKPLSLARACRDLPSDVRSVLANTSAGGGFEHENVDLAATLEALNLTPGATDTLVLGDDTKLQGNAQCERLSVDTRFGPKVIPFDQVAAICGPRSPAHQSLVFLRDGQIISGPIDAKGFRFALSGGSTMDLSVGALDRLVRKAVAPLAIAPEVASLVELLDGDRISVAKDPAFRLHVVTPWGARDVALEEIKSLRAANEGALGYRIALQDGSVFTAFLDNETLPLKTLLYGPQKVAGTQIRSISSAHAAKPADTDQEELTVPNIVLSNNQLLVGQIDLPELHLAANGQVVPIMPGHLRTLHNTNEGDAKAGRRTNFQAELWGGGSVSGELRESLLPFRFGDQVWQLSSRDILDVRVPTPQVPDAVRDKIAQLVRDLGSEEWQKREDASKELEALGFLAKPQLTEAVTQAGDPEVRKRAQALLDALSN